MVSELVPQLTRMLVRGQRLDQSDAEDCIAEVLEKFLDQSQDRSVSDPQAYLSRAAWNCGVTFHRRRRADLVRAVGILWQSGERETDETTAAGEVVVPAEWAIVAVEESLGEVEAEESWAVPVIAAALGKLTVNQRKLLEYLWMLPFDFARKDFEVQSREAAASLGMTPQAFRKAKQRAYEDLRAAIPQAVEDMGVQPPARFAAVFEESRGRFMDDSEE
jgi:DNA-directed RNA polymerase specialized sigma24 family protein